MAERNPYHILGLQKGATEEQIRAAYKLLAKRYHPDRNMGDPTAQSRFIEIKEAYEALIERKSSSSIANVVEEKGAELRRKTTGLSPQIKKFGYAASGFLGIGVAIFFVWWYLLHDAPLRNGLAAARRDDDALAVAYLKPLADDRTHFERSQVARDAMLAVLLRKGRLRRGPGAPASQAFAEDLVKDQPLPRYECVAADLDLFDARARDALPSYRGARATDDPEIWARAYAGFLAAGARTEADALAQDAQKLPDGPWKSWIRSVSDLRAGRPSEFPDDGTPRDKANRAAVLIAELRADAGGATPPGAGDSRYREAISLLEEAIQELDADPPLQPDFGYLRPVAHLYRRSFDWRPTTSAEDSRVAMRLSEAWAASIVGEYETAVSYARLGQSLDSNSVPTEMALGLLQLAAKRFSDADETFKIAAAMGKDRFGGPHAGRARVRQIELDRDSSTVDQQQAIEIEEWKAAIAIDPKEPEFQYGYARTLGRRHDIAGQIEHDRLAAEADPAFGPASLDLGEALLSQKRSAEAMTALQVAAKDPSVAADARFDLGQLHFQKNEYDAALADLTVATGSTKKEVASHAWVLIARIASRQHKLDPGEAAICSLGQLDSEISTQTLSDPELRWLASKFDPRRCPAFGSRP